MARQVCWPPTCLHVTGLFYLIFSPFFLPVGLYPSLCSFPKHPVITPSWDPSSCTHPCAPVDNIPLKSVRWSRDTLMLTHLVGLTLRQWCRSLPCRSPGGNQVRMLQWLCSGYWGFPVCLSVCVYESLVTQPNRIYGRNTSAIVKLSNRRFAILSLWHGYSCLNSTV